MSNLISDIEQYAVKDPALYDILKKLFEKTTANQQLVSGEGNPNNIVAAAPNTIYVERLPNGGQTAAHWIKTGKDLRTGWVKLHELTNPTEPLDYANTFADPAKSGFRTKGSVPPTGSTPFAYTSTTTSITWFWDGTNGSSPLTVYRADGTSFSVSGSQSITGLSATSTYLFYPYFDENVRDIQLGLKFANGSGATGVGGPGSMKNLAFAFHPLAPAPAPNSTFAQLVAAAQLQNLQKHIPFSNGALVASTGQTGTGGGSGGGAGSCFHEDMLAEFQGHPTKMKNLKAGLTIKSRSGLSQITKFDILPGFESWIEIAFSNKDRHVVTQDHLVLLSDGELVKATDVRLGSLVELRKGGHAIIEGVRFLREKGSAVWLCCEPDPLIWCGMSAPSVLGHNIIKL